MIVVGLDPGVSGAVALFDPSKSAASGLRWVVEDLPVVTLTKRSELNVAALRDLLRKFSPEHGFLELVSAMPSIANPKTGERRGMGATSAFNFGGMFFGIQAVLGCCDVPFSLVTPQTWKKFHSLKGSDKEASRRRALQLFPDQAAALRRKMDQNRAEAMLIAAYGANRLGLLAAA